MNKYAARDFRSKYARETMTGQIERLDSCVSITQADVYNPTEFIGTMISHEWQVQNKHKLTGMGLIVRLKCARCQLEWSSIIVEENEREEGLRRLQSDNDERAKHPFEF